MAARAKFNIAVVGGGITGIALALALLKRNVGVQVYEKSPSLDDVDASFVLSPSSLRAARMSSDKLAHAVDEVASKAWGADDRHQTFEYLDGIHQPKDPRRDADSLFISGYAPEAALIDRRELLKAMARRLPRDCVVYGKQLSAVSEQTGNGSVTLTFEDGTESVADAVIGCDGADSRVREIILGHAKAAAKARFARQHSYQAHVSLQDAERATNEQRARTASVYLGYGKYFSMIADREKRIVHLTMLCSDLGGSPSGAIVAKGEEDGQVASQFQDWITSVRQLAALFPPTARGWAVCDMAEEFPSTFVKGRVCLAGDAAHAMTPHLGAGVSSAIEDVAVLAELVADRRVTDSRYLEAVFKAYDRVRKPRAQWLVQASRKAGALQFWNDEGVGNDIPECKRQLAGLHDKAWEFNISISIAEAKQELGSLARGRAGAGAGGLLDTDVSTARQPYAEMLGVYDYVEQAFNSGED